LRHSVHVGADDCGDHCVSAARHRVAVQHNWLAPPGHPGFAGDGRTGIVTSGTHSPTLGKAIAMAYVAPGDGEPGTILDVEIRDQRVSAEVVALPFYKRSPRSPRTDG